MPGDYSRKLFNRQKHYSGVLMQQGRVQLDADWNEQLDLQQYRTRTEAIDLIGPSGVPKKEGGFGISVLPGGTDLVIAPGRIYIAGLLCELEKNGPVTYKQQPWYPNPDTSLFIGSPLSSPPASPPSSPPSSPPAGGIPLSLQNGTYVVYLEAWEREINFHDDPLIQEVALGEADTTTRLQTVWQVKLLKVTTGNTTPDCWTPFKEWVDVTSPFTGKLNAQTNGGAGTTSPCSLPPTAGFRRLENQLYRVEVQKGGLRNNATFKWSRDNATVETTIENVNGSILTVADVGKDDILGFAIGQWVEIIHEAATLNSKPNPLVKIQAVNPATREITLATSAVQYAGIPHLKLRRWDQSDAATADGIAMPVGWTNIEDGIQVNFSAGTYRAGDYWLIPARTATGEIEWPPYAIPNIAPLEQAPAGTPHYYTRLAFLQVQNGLALLDDCRELFPSLTDICAEDICYDSSNCQLQSAHTVQEALDLLCANKGGNCTYTAVPGFGWETIFDNIGAGEDAQVCFQAGVYPLLKPVQINNKGHIKINGAGPGTQIVAATAEAALVFSTCKSVTIRDIYAETGRAVYQDVTAARLNGTLTCINCNAVHIESVNLKCGSAPVRGATCITVRNEVTIPCAVRILNCNLGIGFLQQGILLVNVLRSLVENNTLSVYGTSSPKDLPERLKTLEYRAAVRSIYIYDVELDVSVPQPVPPKPTVTLLFANTSIRFKTYTKLLSQEAWNILLKLNQPKQQVLTPIELLTHIRKIVDRLLLDENFRKNVTGPPGRNPNAFDTLYNALVKTELPVASAGITIGGQIGKEIRVHNNTIEGVLQGVHVGLSHRTEDKGRDQAAAVTITNNNVAVLLPLYTGRWDRHGIFAGNCRSLIIENNNVQLSRADATNNIVVIEGIRIWGLLGERVMVTKNCLFSADGSKANSFDVGIHVNPIVPITTAVTAQWIVTWNVAFSKVATVLVKNGAVAVDNTNTP